MKRHAVDRGTARVASRCGGRIALVATVATVCAFGFAGVASARTLSLKDSASLHKISSHGFKLYETGTAKGTLAGKVYLHLTVSSTNRVTAELSVYPKGGSMSGSGTASYGVSGALAHFSGTMSITRGTGVFAHARASGLKFSGTIRRSNDAVSVQVSGKLSY